MYAKKIAYSAARLLSPQLTEQVDSYFTPLYHTDSMIWLVLCLELTRYFYIFCLFIEWCSAILRASSTDTLSLILLALPCRSPNTVGPAAAPWDTPDPLTCVRQLQSLVGLGFNVGHESAGDLQTLIQSAMSGIRKEVDLHLDFMGTETC